MRGFISKIFIYVLTTLLNIFFVKKNIAKRNERERQKNKNGYKDSVYVEKDEAAEIIRYFLKYKKFSSLIEWHIKSYFKLKYMEVNNKDYLGALEKVRYKSYEETYISNLIRLKNEQILVIRGDAGSGKTNLLYNTLDNKGLSKNFIFIKCRNVNSDYIDDYIEATILNFKIPYIVKKIVKNGRYVFLIDGLNEKPELIENIGELIKAYPKSKFIFTIRNELFDQRVTNCSEIKNAIQIHIKNDLCNVTFDKIITKYEKDFNVNTILEYEKDILRERPILEFQLFFHLKSFDNTKTINFDTDIYKLYLETIYNIEELGIINKVVELMISTKKYYDINISSLSPGEKKILTDISSNSLLVANIEKNIGSIVLPTEEISFIFDEFRDYLIAAKLFEIDVKLDDISSIFPDNCTGKLNSFRAYRSNITEGVISKLYVLRRDCMTMELYNKFQELEGYEFKIKTIILKSNYMSNFELENIEFSITDLNKVLCNGNLNNLDFLKYCNEKLDLNATSIILTSDDKNFLTLKSNFSAFTSDFPKLAEAVHFNYMYQNEEELGDFEKSKYISSTSKYYISFVPYEISERKFLKLMKIDNNKNNITTKYVKNIYDSHFAYYRSVKKIYKKYYAKLIKFDDYMEDVIGMDEYNNQEMIVRKKYEHSEYFIEIDSDYIGYPITRAIFKEVKNDKRWFRFK